MADQAFEEWWQHYHRSYPTMTAGVYARENALAGWISRGRASAAINRTSAKASDEPNCPLITGMRPCMCPRMPRCPECNYTEHDARFEMDHDACKGTIPAASVEDGARKP